jgi:hypothetical protein
VILSSTLRSIILTFHSHFKYFLFSSLHTFVPFLGCHKLWQLNFPQFIIFYRGRWSIWELADSNYNPHSSYILMETTTLIRFHICFMFSLSIVIYFMLGVWIQEGGYFYSLDNLTSCFIFIFLNHGIWTQAIALQKLYVVMLF